MQDEAPRGITGDSADPRRHLVARRQRGEEEQEEDHAAAAAVFPRQHDGPAGSVAAERAAERAAAGWGGACCYSGHQPGGQQREQRHSDRVGNPTGALSVRWRTLRLLLAHSAQSVAAEGLRQCHLRSGRVRLHGQAVHER